MKKILILPLTATALLAAQQPNIGNILQEIKKPDVLKQEPKLIEIEGIKNIESIKQDDKKSKTIFIKEFKIEGALKIKEQRLQELIKGYTNKELTFKELLEVTTIITKEYRKEGFFVARAYIPKQSIKDDTLQINIIEGYYGEFKLKNDSLVKDYIVQAMLNSGKKEGVVSTDTLERAMLIINDAPGVQVTSAEVMPGEKVGTSDFEIVTEASPKYDGYLIGDNYGSKYTDDYRLLAGINLNSLTKMADQLSINGILTHKANLKSGSIVYSFPLMSNGLRGKVGYDHTEYELVKDYESLDADGKSKILSAGVSYPIKRTRSENLYLNATFYSKGLTDYQSNAIVTDKDVDSLEIDLSYDKTTTLFNLPSEIVSSFNFTRGDLDIKDETTRTNDASGDQTQGTYNKIKGSLGTTITFNEDYSLSSSFSFQKALGGKNLDGSEEMSVGGAYGVKVYPNSESSASNGMMLNTELFRQLPSFQNVSHRISIFYDIAKVSMSDDSQNVTFEKRSLQDIGIGHYASYKSFFSKAHLARSIGGAKVTSEDNYNTKLLFQLGWTF